MTSRLGEDIRKALDKAKLVFNLATVRLGLVLRFGELLGGGVLLECDLILLIAFAPVTPRGPTL